MRAALCSVLLVVACKQAAPPEGASLLERTKAAVDAVCACGTDQTCRNRELAVYEAIVAEVGPTNVSGEIVEALAKEADRVQHCGEKRPKP